MPVGFSDIKSREIVISEGCGGPLRAFGNILLPDRLVIRVDCAAVGGLVNLNVTVSRFAMLLV
jgi:hypothetical protein